MTSQSFEQVLNSVPAQGSFTPAWKKFVKTKFFVQVLRAVDNNPRNFSLHIAPDPDSGKPSVLISEQRERLNRQHGNATAALYGADIVKLLADDAAILVALSDRAFEIASARVAWLRAGILAAQARAAESSVPAASGEAAPAVTLEKAPVAAPPAPFVPLLGRAGEPLPDMAALMPRAVGLPTAGLTFEVPGAWQETPNVKGLIFFDAESGTKVEASAILRLAVSMPQWLQMRADQMALDMPFMRVCGPAYRLGAPHWGERIEGMATEYSGSFPGSGIESCCLLACIRMEGVLVSLIITAPSAVFEQSAELYKWLLGQVDLGPPGQAAPPTPRAPAGGSIAAKADADNASLIDAEPPAVFGVTMHGRLGRLRAMAYGFAIMLPLAAIAIASALMGTAGMILIGVVMVIAVFLSLRVLVLRLHDINWSGKWLWAPILLSGLAGALQKPQLVAFVGGAFWLLVGVSLYLIPGSETDNDFGPPPPDNSTAIKVCAALCIVLQLGALFGSSRLPGRSSSTTLAGSSYTFTTDDKALTVQLPAKPREVPTPAHVQARMGDVSARQFHLEDDKRIYMVQVIDYKLNNNGEEMLELAESRIVGPEGTAMLQKDIEVNGYRGREVRAASLDGRRRGARLFMIDKRLIMVMMEAPLAPGNDAAMDRYLNSVVLKTRP